VPKKLFKALVVLTVVAAALGGAAALGSTLFASPPRDAAEFAQWVERGSRHADPNRKPPKPEKRGKGKARERAERSGPTPAEQRYGRTLNTWCVEQEDDVAALGSAYAADWLSRWLTVSRSWRARVAALDHPAGFEGRRARYLSSWERLESLSLQLFRASGRGDSVASLEVYDRWVHTAARNSDAAIGMGADRCAGALFQGITPS
jgi:hypothetical protein